jgi:hypothetical protein
MKKRMNIEFNVLGKKKTNNKKEFKGKKEMTNPIRLVATGM